MDVLIVGEEGAPRKGASDPELIRTCESERRFFISADRETVPGFVTEHIRQGAHTWGVCIVDVEARLAQVLDELELIFGASGPDEWIDQL